MVMMMISMMMIMMMIMMPMIMMPMMMPKMMPTAGAAAAAEHAAARATERDRRRRLAHGPHQRDDATLSDPPPCHLFGGEAGPWWSQGWQQELTAARRRCQGG